MKKFWLFVLALVLSLTSLGLSEIDYDSMTTDELYALRDEVTEAIRLREGMLTLPAGFYVVGLDFPAGSYLIICHVVPNAVNDFGSVTVYPDPKAVGTGKHVTEILDDGERYIPKYLEEGAVLELKFASFDILKID